MGRFLCVLALCTLLAGNMWAKEMHSTQTVFFSLLFPQLMIDIDAENVSENACWWEVMYL